VPPVLIFGASGYSGLELLRLLGNHPEVKVVGASSDKYAGEPVRRRVPSFPGALAFEPHEAVEALSGEIAFLATPAKTSLALAPRLLSRGLRVIDLSGAFRLKDPAAYPTWYGFTHEAAPVLAEAAYGLPELPTAAAPGRLVANPGCYATAAIMAVAPFLSAGLIAPGAPIFLDGKSGTTGAGRTLEEGLLHAEVDANLRPYRLLQHQHTPEIEQALTQVAGRTITVSFSAHLIPMRRGLMVSAYLPAAPGTTEEKVQVALQNAYRAHPFVRISERPPETGTLTGSNFVELHARYDQRVQAVLAFAAIDNLVKGAAGQAVQNLNRMLNLPETTGLLPEGWVTGR